MSGSENLLSVLPQCTIRFSACAWWGGCTNEMLKVCFDDKETLQLLGLTAADFARATSPRNVTHCSTLATLTALQKKDGGVRGIVTGTSFRRLVAKTLAKQFGKTVEAACAPFQFALSTRARVDCVGHAVRAITDMDPKLMVWGPTIMSSEVPCWRNCWRFLGSVLCCHSCVTSIEVGRRHEVQQCESGEQGDPLMPLLFNLAIHNALKEAKREMLDGEELFAFVDDVYILSSPARTRFLYNLVGEKLSNMAVDPI